MMTRTYYSFKVLLRSLLRSLLSCLLVSLMLLLTACVALASPAEQEGSTRQETTPEQEASANQDNDQPVLSDFDSLSQTSLLFLQQLPAQSPQVEALEAARVLLNEGDTLQKNRRMDDARAKWEEATEKFKEAEDSLGRADAFLRIADSLQSEAIFNTKKLQEALGYYLLAITAATDTYESLIVNELGFDTDILEQANEAYNEGERLRKAGNCTQAVPKFNEARRLFAQIDFGSGEARSLAFKAVCQIDAGNFFESLTTLLDALFIVQSLPLGSSETERFLDGKRAYQSGDLAGSVEIFAEVLESYQKKGRKDVAAQVMIDMGVAYAELGQFAEAKKLFETALPIFIELEDDYDEYNEAVVRHNLANFVSTEGEFDVAISEYQQAIELWWVIGEPLHRVHSLSGLALAYNGQGQYKAAFEALDQADEQYALVTPNPSTAGDLLNNRGVLHNSLGEYNEALSFFEQALTIRREIQGPQGIVKEAESLGNIAAIQSTHGRFDDSLETYERMRRILDDHPIALLEAQLEANIGTIYIQQDNLQRGLFQYLKAKKLFQSGQLPLFEATLLQNLSAVYIKIGNYGLAEESLLEAREFFVEMENLASVAVVDGNLGNLFFTLERFDQALSHYEKAKELWEQVGNQSAIVNVNINLALIAVADKEYNQAIQLGEEALAQIREADLQIEKGRALVSLATIYIAHGDFQTGYEYALEALTVAEDFDNDLLKIFSRMLITTFHMSTGDLKNASQEMDKAMDRFEALQGTLTVAELKSSVLGRFADIYKLAVTLALLEEDTEKAFALTEQARARALLDQLANQWINFHDSDNSIQLSNEQELHLERRRLRNSIAEENVRELKNQNQERITRLKKDLEEADKQLQQIQTELKISNPIYSSLVTPQPLSTADVQDGLLDNTTTLIAYYILEKSVQVWVVDKKNSQHVSLALEADELQSRIENLRLQISDTSKVKDSEDALDDLTDINQKILAPLYSDLIAPILPYIEHEKLIIIPNGSLHYLPFGALWDSVQETYLTQRYSIRYAPSASVLQFLHAKGDKLYSLPLVIGNPGSDLAFASNEATTVAKLYEVEPLLHNYATESAARSLSTETHIIHVAAHGVYNDINPMYSHLELTSDDKHDGYLEVHEIHGLNLSDAKLVVLSACDTSQGELTGGDEVLSLNRAFLAAGAPAVVTSLWPVDDEATSVFMQTFHEQLQNGTSATKALQIAQQTVMTEEKWASPYYWAAFSLTGADIRLDSLDTKS
ncbi:MAG: CHAT domain-containing protein [Chloroflexota bacterium]